MKACIYILLPVYNRCAITNEFIDCLVVQTCQNYHLVLIDDGSTDGTDQMVRKRVENLSVISGEGDWWWAGCLQQGFNFLKRKEINDDDSVLIINDDVVFGKEFLEKGIMLLEENRQAILLAQFQDGDNSPSKETGIHVNFKEFSFSAPSAAKQINCLSTRGLFLKWSDFEAVGGFYPKILPHYWSDYEFTIRAHKKGYRCLTSPDVTLTPKLNESGRADLDYSSYLRLLGSLFSIKTIQNPVYQISFIFLACPLRWIPRNFLKIFLKTLLINFRYPIRKLKTLLLSMMIQREVKKYGEDYKVIVGAGGTNYPGWISTKYPALDILDSDSISKYFERESVQVFLAEHVFEHLTYQQAESSLAICKEYLAPGGYLRIAVPDGLHPSAKYIDAVKPDGFGAGSDDHKVLYNYKTLTDIIKKAGFGVKLLEWWDHDAKFHFVDWQPETGFVKRSSRFDQRNSDSKLNYTSLIVDAIKS